MGLDSRLQFLSCHRRAGRKGKTMGKPCDCDLLKWEAKVGVAGEAASGSWQVRGKKAGASFGWSFLVSDEIITHKPSIPRPQCRVMESLEPIPGSIGHETAEHCGPGASPSQGTHNMGTFYGDQFTKLYVFY